MDAGRRGPVAAAAVTEFLSSLAIHLSRHPFVLTVVIAAAAGLAGAWSLKTTRALVTALVVVSGTALVAYVAAVVFYAASPQYFDAAEPTMTAVGWLFQAGLPVYHEVDSPERYSHIYGPMVFIAHGAALTLFGATIGVSKAVGCALALGALACTFLALRTVTSLTRAVVLTGCVALLLLGFRNYSFWTRAEPLQVFCVAAALASIGWRRPLLVGIWCGVLAGVLWNLKITGPLYSLPLFVLVVMRGGWGPAAVAAVVAAVTAVVPFVLFANVSLEGYLTWFRLSAQTGLLLATLRQNLEWALFVTIPVVLAYFATTAAARPTREWTLTAAATALAAIGVMVAGSKPGAGPYHLLPLLPVLAYLAADRIRRLELRPVAGFVPLTAAFLLVASATALAQQVHFVTVMTSRRTQDIRGDLERFTASHPGVTEIGYAVNDPVTFQRPLLVFRNNAYFLDQPAIGEHLLAGIETPASTVHALKACRVDYWLIPKGEEPFSGVNMYAAVHFRPLFSRAFRQAFFETHALVGSTDFFDVWRCRR